jgi:nanoRNase/pAp phosphatase (c-di-AMP/oligoRNAs hydrolase)
MINDKKKDLFTQAISKYSTIHIFMHDHPAPDPDSIASGLGMKKLIKDIFQKRAIIHGIPVNHRMNVKMLSELEITLEDPREKDPFHCSGNYSLEQNGIVLVDCTLKSGAFKHIEGLAGREPDWVLDHHPDKETTDLEYVDLQAVGSCSTIVTEYLQAFGVKFDPESAQDKFVATALMLGLMVDTNNLLSDDVDKKRDIDVFIYLKERYDQDAYTRIMKYDYPVHFYENMQQATKHVAEPFAILNLGFLKEERLGSIPHIADYWIRRERITMVVVFAVCGKEITASVRAKEGCPFKASEIAKMMFPTGTAGGRGRDMGGASVAINGFWDIESLDEEGKKSFMQLTMATLVSRFKKIIDLDE